MKDWNDKIFNMDLLFLERINMRLDELDKVTISGDQFIRYRVMNTIFMDTYFKYEADREQIEERFRLVKNLLKVQAPNRATIVQHQALIINEVEELLDELHLILMKILYINDLIYLKKTIKLTPEQEVEADY